MGEGLESSWRANYRANPDSNEAGARLQRRDQGERRRTGNRSGRAQAGAQPVRRVRGRAGGAVEGEA